MLKRTQVEGKRGTHSENPVGFLLRTAPGVAPFARPAQVPRTRRESNVVFYPCQPSCIPSRIGTAAASVALTALHLLNIFLASLRLHQSLRAMVRRVSLHLPPHDKCGPEFSRHLSTARHPKPTSIASHRIACVQDGTFPCISVSIVDCSPYASPSSQEQLPAPSPTLLRRSRRPSLHSAEEPRSRALVCQ